MSARLRRDMGIPPAFRSRGTGVPPVINVLRPASKGART